MQVEYKRDLNHNYLIIHGESDIDTASYQVRMILAGQIPMLLPCQIQVLDGKALLYYEITSRQSLTSFYENKKMLDEDMRPVFQGFMEVVRQLRSFLLDPDQLLLVPEYIYLDAGGRQLYFCCLPGEGKSIGEQFCSLIEYLLPKIDHKDSAAVALGYGVYRCAMEDGFQMEDLKRELFRKQGTLNEKADTAVKPEETAWEESEFTMENGRVKESDIRQDDRELKNLFGIKEKKRHRFSGGQAAGVGITAAILAAVLYLKWSGELLWLTLPVLLGILLVAAGSGILVLQVKNKRKPITDTAADGAEGYRESPQPCEKAESEIWKTNREGCGAKEDEADGQEEEQEEPSDDQTVVLSSRKEPQVSALVSKNPGQFPTVILDKELVIVGKLEIAVDTVIPFPTVSRIHAKIKRTEDGYILTDLNSKNGTYVNGHLLAGEEAYRLNNEDQVNFADTEYVFLE